VRFTRPHYKALDGTQIGCPCTQRTKTNKQASTWPLLIQSNSFSIHRNHGLGDEYKATSVERVELLYFSVANAALVYAYLIQIYINLLSTRSYSSFFPSCEGYRGIATPGRH
jgi:hypothetical protein